MSIIIHSNALSIVIVAVSFILLLGPTSMTMNVVATTNTANQGIGQSQSSLQLGVCVSGNGTLFSCNNANSQNQQTAETMQQPKVVVMAMVAVTLQPKE